MDCEIRVRNIQMTAFWHYDVDNRDCPICHKDLQKPTNQAFQRRLIQNNVTIGQCNHGVHRDCIERWKIDNRNCPSCMIPWVPRADVDSLVRVLGKSVDREKESDYPTKYHDDVQQNDEVSEENIDDIM